MRQLSIAFLLVVAFATIVKAQFFLGTTVGVNYGGPIGKVDGTGKPIPGFIGGAAFNYKLSQKWKLSAMLLYSFRGAEYSQTTNNDSTVNVTINQQQVPVTTNYTSTVNGKIKLHYIDLPLLASYYITNRTSIDCGPQLSYVVGGSDKGTNNIVFVENGVFNQKLVYNNYSEINKIDYAITLGSTYYTKYGLNVALRASRGFRPLYKKGFFSSRGFTETGLYNTFVHLTVGYTFGKNATE